MSRTIQTRAVVEGALMASLTAILALASIYIPLLQMVAFLVWSIPIIYVTVRHGLVTGILSLSVCGFLIFLFSSPFSALGLVIHIGGVALVYGYCFHKKLKPSITVLLGIVVLISSLILMFFLMAAVTGVGISGYGEMLDQSVQSSIELYKSIGLLDPAQGITEESLREMMDTLWKTIITLLPGFVVFYGISWSIINYILAQKILARFDIEVIPFPKFRDWKLPWWIVWGFILGMGLNMGGFYLQNRTMTIIGDNIMLVYKPILLVMGLALIAYYIHHRLRGEMMYKLMLMLFLVFLSPLSSNLVLGLALVDLLFNLRKYIQGKLE